MAAIYLCLWIAFNLPFVTKQLSLSVSHELSRKFGSEVSVGDIKVGLFNRIDLLDVNIKDQKNQPLFSAKIAGVRFELTALLKNEIVVKNMGLYDSKINLYRATPESKPNYQFLIDSLAPKKPSKPSKIRFSARSFICRNLNLKYNVLNQRTTPGIFNPNHIDISKFDGNFRFRSLQKDSINIRVRDICLHEQSGFEIKRTVMQLVAANNQLRIQNLRLELPNSFISSPEIIVNTPKNKLRILSMRLKSRLQSNDFKCFYAPLRNLPKTESAFVTLDAHDTGNGLSVVSSIRSNDGFSLQGSHLIDQKILNGGSLHLVSHIEQLSTNKETTANLLNALPNIPQKISDKLLAAGEINQSGILHVAGENIGFEGRTQTSIGNLKEDFNKNGNALSGTLQLDNVLLGALFPNSPLATNSANALSGETNGIIKINGSLSPTRIQFNSQFSNFFLNGYNYCQTSVEGSVQGDELSANIKMDDPNANLMAKIEANLANGLNQARLSSNIQNLNPKVLNLTGQFGNSTISGNVDVEYFGFQSNNNNRLVVRNFQIKDATSSFRTDSLLLQLASNTNLARINLQSDFLDGQIKGNVSVDKLADAVLSFIEKPFPAIRRFVSFRHTNNGDLDFRLKIKNSDFLSYFFHIPVQLQKVSFITGYLDSKANRINLTAWLPQFKINDEPYSDASLYLKGSSDSLNLLSQLTKTFGQTDVRIAANSQITGNCINPSIEWKTINSNGTSGNIHSHCQFYGSEEKNRLADIRILPSSITIKDTLWNISPSTIRLAKSGTLISPISLQNGRQFIAVSNSTENDAQSPYRIALNEIEISHIQDLLNFHPVDFSGKATGSALIPIAGNNRDIPIRLIVNNFKFENGDMGALNFNGRWDASEKKVRIDAVASQTPRDSTLIKGFVDIGEDAINLNFKSYRTNIAFLNSWLEGVMGTLHGTTTGSITLHGPLSNMNLYGMENFDTLSFHLPLSNITYHAAHDSIKFEYGKIIFQNITLRDSLGGSTIVSGPITHNCLKDFGYDLNFRLNNLFVYDWTGEEKDLFWGKVHGDGSGRLWGNTSNVHAQLDITPTPNTTFCYDGSTQENAEGAEFIRFHNGQEKSHNGVSASPEAIKTSSALRDSSTNIFLNINTNLNPDCDLVIYTDHKTGDGMTLRGNGPVSTSWYNKGRFRISGLYTTTDGEYRLTIKDLLHRKFAIQPGGTMRFTGGAEDGDLNLKGIYTAHSVSLSDLNLGANMSNGTTNVNCIMNFGGKSNNPQVSFGLEFPTAGDDLERTLRSAISSQEDLNMQMLYLLTIGRFYTYDYATSAASTTQNQSVLTMQSLFAGTLGSRLGGLISQAFHLNNWTIGPNISTGRMGWEDMEVGGQIQGSLLKNRLQLSGNFGYREQNTYANNFVGDFYIRWLLNNPGTISLKAYSETNDRYFSRSSLSTQGGGIQFQKNFNRLPQFIRFKKKDTPKESKTKTTQIQ